MKPRWHGARHSKARLDAVASGYRSGLEAGIAADLEARGVKFEYEKRTIRYVRPVRSGHCGDCGSKSVGKWCVYTPDFEIPGAILVESKGRFTGSDRTKLAAIKLQHPSLDLRILFAVDNWTTKLHKQRYSDWATKHGLVFAVGKVIPREWLEG